MTDSQKCEVCGATDSNLRRFGVTVDGDPLRMQPVLCEKCGDRFLLRAGALFAVLKIPTGGLAATLYLDEADRQMVLLALARLSVERPGWEYCLHAIALQIDAQSEGRALMFDNFRGLTHRPRKE